MPTQVPEAMQKQHRKTECRAEVSWTKNPGRGHRKWTDSVKVGERFYTEEAKDDASQGKKASATVATMATRKQVQEALQRKETVRTGTREEGARSRRTMPSSFAKSTKTNEKVRFVVPPEVPHDVESDVAEEMMSVTVKLAKEIDEPSDIELPTAECQSRTFSKQRRVIRRDELRPVQGGEEDTDERVMTSHTEKCEKSENYAKESQEAKLKLSF